MDQRTRPEGMRFLLLSGILLAAGASAQPPVAGAPAAQRPLFDDRYRAANAALPAPTDHRVVFMGDSITEAWAPQPFLHDGADHVGRGISGQTTPQMIARFSPDVIDLKPRVVHIMGGTNDVAGNGGPETDAEIQHYIATMVETAQAHGIRVVLASIPPAAGFPWRPTLGVPARIRRLNAWIERYAAAHDAVYADYWPALALPSGAMKPEYSQDGVHPNAAGYAAMAPIARAAIDRALAGR